MYEEFYGLTRAPFDLTPNPKFLLLTPTHREALHMLEYGVMSRKGIILLLGDAGTGKTTAVAPVVRGFSFLVDKGRLQPQVHMGDEVHAVAVPHGQSTVPPPDATPAVDAQLPREDWPQVPLVQLAWARSGDKGNHSNIGVIARRPEWLPWLRGQLTPQRVKEWLGHLVQGDVTRYDVPGIDALNFLCTDALDGGGMASLRNDPLGKGMAQILLSMPVAVPPRLAVTLGVRSTGAAREDAAQPGYPATRQSPRRTRSAGDPRSIAPPAAPGAPRDGSRRCRRRRSPAAATPAAPPPAGAGRGAKRR